jgi:hypothetical protein
MTKQQPNEKISTIENRPLVAEQLMNNKLQMRASSATENVVTLTKQTKIGLCEQVRVN